METSQEKDATEEKKVEEEADSFLHIRMEGKGIIKETMKRRKWMVKKGEINPTTRHSI